MRYSELIENLDDASDDELFGKPTKSNYPDDAVRKFKTMFSYIRRVPDGSTDVAGKLIDLFELGSDNRFHTGGGGNYASWGTEGYTSLGSPVGVLHSHDTGGGSWTYIGARNKQELEDVLQMLYDINMLENPEAKRERIAAARQRKLAAAEKKGIRVGSRIQTHMGTDPGTVVHISPAGKITIEYDYNGERGTYTTTPGAIRKADVIKDRKSTRLNSSHT